MAPYAAELVRQQLEQMYGDRFYTDGFKFTPLSNSNFQTIANQAVRDNLLAYDQRHGYRGPEKTPWHQPIDNMEAWEQTLSKISTLMV